MYPRKHLGSMVWSCDVCHADLSTCCTPPSLFIRTKTCLWPLRHLSEPLHKHGKPDQFQSCQTAACQLCTATDRTNSLWIDEFMADGKLGVSIWPVMKWQDFVHRLLKGSKWWNYQVSKRDLPSAWQFNYPSVSLSCWVIILNKMRWNGLSS